MPKFEVSWSASIEANSHEEAAIQAFKIQLDRSHDRRTFNVTEHLVTAAKFIPSTQIIHLRYPE